MILSASLICLDLLNLGTQIRALEHEGIDRLHVDLIDGHFSSNLGLPLYLLPQIRKFSRLPIDVHLMVSNPEMYFGYLVEHGMDLICVHLESIVDKSDEIGALVHQTGASLGLAISPGTEIDGDLIRAFNPHKITVVTVQPGFKGQNFIKESLETIYSLRSLQLKNECQFILEADGAIGPETIPLLIEAGCQSLVIGSTVFGDGQDVRGMLSHLRDTLCRLHG
jgi:ribulose-phosphate 3-epimerase